MRYVRLAVAAMCLTAAVAGAQGDVALSTVAPLPVGPVRISGGVMAANILTTVPPVYPPIAKAAHVAGAVVLHAIIGKDGMVETLTAISGAEMLRFAAIDAVRQWRYTPYLLNGQPVEVDTTVTVSFNLTDTTAVTSVPGDQPGAETGAAPPAAPTRIARIAGGVMAGQILTKVPPVYPDEAKAKHIDGTVVMRAVIGRDGNIANLTVISGPEELRSSAVDAVSQWTYRPYLLNGQPTEVDTTITVNYSFGSSSKPRS